MKKKVILITGTNSGFGWLTANSCAALGHKVYATMRDTNGRNAGKATALSQQANIEVLDVEVTNGKSVSDAVISLVGGFVTLKSEVVGDGGNCQSAGCFKCS